VTGRYVSPGQHRQRARYAQRRPRALGQAEGRGCVALHGRALALGTAVRLVGQLERILREAPDDVRTVVLRGLRAALEWSEKQQRGGS
jgi:hypothetical protein